MSGPVTAADVDPVPAADVLLAGAVEVMDSRSAVVGELPVRRALPQRGRRTVGAWCFFDHAGPIRSAGEEAGIGPHPHIGLQTVTWVLAGELLHRDSLGSEQPIRPGELNLMTAGNGVVHAEEHTSTGPVHLTQLWVAQPSATRQGPPAFEHHGELPEVELGDGRVTVLVGAIGDASSPARRDTDHVGAELIVGSEMAVPVDPAHEHAVVPLVGAVEVEGQPAEPGRLVYVGTGRHELRLRASEPARAFLLGGVPFDEPIVMWWNYVARTRDEVVDAHRDWAARSDRFPVPASALAPIDVGPPPWAPGESPSPVS